ncbi:hypothetical protein TNCV_3724651, partial [Trichonephila clavipes]
MAGLSEPMNSDSDAEINNETRSKTVIFSNALHCLETVTTYFIKQNANETALSPLHKVDRCALLSLEKLSN